MENQQFKAFIVEEINNDFKGSIRTKQIKELPAGDLLIKVSYSSLNYKDALSASGNKGVTKKYPHTPGIDAVGIVVQSNNSDFTTGDKVIVTSYDLGMNTDGGFAEYIRVPSEWVVKLPEKLSEKEAMIYGTAGLTAGIAIQRLIDIVSPEDGDIVVSGATGGVGAISVAVLNKLGYSVTAITGKESEKDYLFELGANKIILRNEFENMDKKPLLKPVFAGAIDTVGGVILENIIKSTKPMGAVACCGNVASSKLEITVFPFILRGISLIGVDSQNYPMKYRKNVWEMLAEEWKPIQIQNTYNEIMLEQLPEKIAMILQGGLKRRVVVKL